LDNRQRSLGDWHTHSRTTSWYEGTPCSGTNLGGNYPSDTDSRLISPAIELPSVVGDEEIILSFWQWFSYDACDQGQVQISVQQSPGIWSAWADIGNFMIDNSLWSRKRLDLTSFAGETVHLAFYHTADGGYLCTGSHMG